MTGWKRINTESTVAAIAKPKRLATDFGFILPIKN